MVAEPRRSLGDWRRPPVPVGAGHPDHTSLMIPSAAPCDSPPEQIIELAPDAFRTDAGWPPLPVRPRASRLRISPDTSASPSCAPTGPFAEAIPVAVQMLPARLVSRTRRRTADARSRLAAAAAVSLPKRPASHLCGALKNGPQDHAKARAIAAFLLYFH